MQLRIVVAVASEFLSLTLVQQTVKVEMASGRDFSALCMPPLASGFRDLTMLMLVVDHTTHWTDSWWASMFTFADHLVSFGGNAGGP